MAGGGLVGINAAGNDFPMTASEDYPKKCHTTKTSRREKNRAIIPDGIRQYVGEGMATPTRPRAKNAVGGNAPSSSPRGEEVGIRETTRDIGKSRIAWGNRFGGRRSAPIPSSMEEGRWIVRLDGAPMANSLHRTARTFQGADLVWGRQPDPTLACHWFPEIGIGVEAVELAQSGATSMKRPANSSVYKAREEAMRPFRFQVRNPEINAKAD